MGATFPVETTVSILVLLEIALEVHANCLYPSRQRGVRVLILRQRLVNDSPDNAADDLA